MREFVLIMFSAVCFLILLETAFTNDIPEDVVRRKK